MLGSWSRLYGCTRTPSGTCVTWHSGTIDSYY